MTAKLYAMTCGRLVGRLKDMIEGEDGQVGLPIPSYLIEHPKGRAVVRHRHASAMPNAMRPAGSASGWRGSSASSSTAPRTT